MGDQRNGTRSVFKEPLCVKCGYYQHVTFTDGDQLVFCRANIPITPNRLATACGSFSHKLGDGFWEQYAKMSMKIPIIGTKGKRVVKVGYDSSVDAKKVDDDD